MDNVVWDYRNPHEWMQRVRTSAMPPVIVTCALTAALGLPSILVRLRLRATRRVVQAPASPQAGAPTG